MPASFAHFMDSAIISDLDQGFRFASPMALCRHPFQGLKAKSWPALLLQRRMKIAT
jgi:hypothetical protein